MVKKDYDGLVICTYLGDEIWGKNYIDFSISGNKNTINDYIINIIGEEWKNKLYFLAEWYRHWDTSSGVIWSMEGLDDFKLAKRLTTFDNVKI